MWHEHSDSDLSWVQALGDISQGSGRLSCRKTTHRVQRVSTCPWRGAWCPCRWCVARTQIKAPQARHVREVDHASIRDAPAETQVEHFKLGQAFRDVLEGQVRQLLTILQGQVFQTEAALRRAAGHTSQVPYAHIRHMPAAPQIKAFESVQTPRNEQQARVRDVTAAAQFQHLQVFQILRLFCLNWSPWSACKGSDWAPSGKGSPARTRAPGRYPLSYSSRSDSSSRCWASPGSRSWGCVAGWGSERAGCPALGGWGTGTDSLASDAAWLPPPSTQTCGRMRLSTPCTLGPLCLCPSRPSSWKSWLKSLGRDTRCASPSSKRAQENKRR